LPESKLEEAVGVKEEMAKPELDPALTY